MCKLLLGIKLNEEKNSEFERILRLQEKSLKDQPHGIAAIKIEKDDKVKTFKRINKYKKVFADVYRNFSKVKIVGIHTRQATSGKINVENTHFFEIDDYLFAHNGIVGNYYYGYGDGFQKVQRFGGEGGFSLRNSDYLKYDKTEVAYDNDGAIIEKPPAKINENKMCDSYNFFKALPKPITKKVLEKAVDNEFSGSGVGLVIDKKNRKIFLMTTREVNTHTDFESYLFIYSFEPNNKLRNYHHYCGFKMYNPDDEQELETLNIPAGVYEFDYNLKVGLVKEIKDK